MRQLVHGVARGGGAGKSSTILAALDWVRPCCSQTRVDSACFSACN